MIGSGSTGIISARIAKISPTISPNQYKNQFQNLISSKISSKNQFQNQHSNRQPEKTNNLSLPTSDIQIERSHVPKFGNWEGDNVPYTAYFENARIEKVGGMRINPNDPQENPDAFNFGLSVPACVCNSPDKPVAAEKYQQGQQKSSSHKSIASESGSDRSTSDNALVQPHHQRRRSDRNSSSTENHISPSPGSNKLNYVDNFSQRSVSVPKFGEWNNKDPRAGEGFTVIFNKVKEGKQIAAAKLPSVPVQTANSHPTNHKTTTRSKMGTAA
ncbi:RPM1-interacting protein 4-like [Forsythia ovata]|uniref:RPM1-interacting protein 4-like n=1 Tax=Forsythia ovata TaxID=205694 RepID=A0ABD1S5T9_9LAMI